MGAIKKYIAANYKVDIVKISPFIRKSLKKGVESKKLLQTKGTGASGRFKLAAAAAKPKKAKKAKKVAKKKPAKKPASEKKAKAPKKPKSPKKAKAPKKAKTPKKAAKKAAPKKK